jgi:hypothetical protein
MVQNYEDFFKQQLQNAPHEPHTEKPDFKDRSAFTVKRGRLNHHVGFVNV